MKSILLTGGTGFVGGHLREVLSEEVVLLGREEPELRANETWRRLDLTRPVSPEKLDGGEVLCHLAYSRCAGKENISYNRHLIEAVNASPGVRRVILMSSVSVYGENRFPTVNEESPCYPVDEYSQTKLACEKAWWEGLRQDRELVVLRPTEVVGPGGFGLRALIRDALDRPVVGTLKRSVLYYRPLRYVAVGNVVAAALFCLSRRQTCTREAYIVAEERCRENESYAIMQDFVRKLLGKQPLPGPPMPRPLVRVLAELTGRPLEKAQVFESRKIREAGFQSVTTLADEVRFLLTGSRS